RRTAFIWMRPVDMLGPAVQTGGVTERSMISVGLVAGLPPPKLMTRGVYAGGSSGRRTEEPYIRSRVVAAETVQVAAVGSKIHPLAVRVPLPWPLKKTSPPGSTKRCGKEAGGRGAGGPGSR